MGAAAPSRAAPRAPVPAPRALRSAEPLWPRSSQAASPAGRRWRQRRRHRRARPRAGPGVREQQSRGTAPPLSLFIH